MLSIGHKLFAKWDVILLFLSIAVVLCFEILGVFGKQYVTITEIVRTYIPAWVRAMVLGWMVYHFVVAQ